MRRTAEAWSKSEAMQHEIDRSAGRQPSPGDLYLLGAAADGEVEWLVLAPADDGSGGFLVAPADTVPLLGGADVAIEAGAAVGPLYVRCGFTVQVPAAILTAAGRTGLVEPEAAARARERWRRLEAGRATASTAERDAEADPDYQDHRRVLAAARDALRQRVGTPARAGARSPSRLLGFAAAALLVAGLLGALGATLVRNQRLSSALRHAQQPLTNLPVAWLSGGQSRGAAARVSLSPATRPLLILRLPDGEPEGLEYRLEIRREQGREPVWSATGLREVGLSEMTVIPPAGLLEAGEYRLLLFRQEAAQPLERYRLIVALE